MLPPSHLGWPRNWAKLNGVELAKLMIDHGVGVTEVATYTVKKLDLDYFGDED